MRSLVLPLPAPAATNTSALSQKAAFSCSVVRSTGVLRPAKPLRASLAATQRTPVTETWALTEGLSSYSSGLHAINSLLGRLQPLFYLRLHFIFASTLEAKMKWRRR